MRKTFNIPRSNFKRLETLDFRDIIEQITDISYSKSDVSKTYDLNVTLLAKRINFKLDFDIPDLFCKELIDIASNMIIEYHYNWGNSSGNIMNFHAHFHPDEAPAHIKAFDPLHILTREVGK